MIGKWATGPYTGHNRHEAPFWAKDYGGKAKVRAEFYQDARLVFTYDLGVPYDRDLDGLSDAWERAKVAEWQELYGGELMSRATTFFGPIDDKEPKDPDGPGHNTLPEHKHAGDHLFVLEEYRGFILDGGHGAFPGGHTRLSPVRKELLVETDMMKDVPNMPSVADMKGVLNTMVGGFEHPTTGAGIWVYWVLDQTAAEPLKSFASTNEAAEWATGPNRNAWLGDFVHLMFAWMHGSLPGTFGYSQTFGSYVFVSRVRDATAVTDDFKLRLATTAAHEVTHLLMDTNNKNGFDGNEHEHNPDPEDPPESDGDKKYLMYFEVNSQNWEQFIFSQGVRAQLDLTSKESVDRK